MSAAVPVADAVDVGAQHWCCPPEGESAEMRAGAERAYARYRVPQVIHPHPMGAACVEGCRQWPAPAEEG